MSLHLHHISKAYNGHIALEDINLTLDQGVVALLGANGSGKTTLLRLLATLDLPDTGTIRWRNLDYGSNLDWMRQQIGYLPQALELPEHLTPYRLLHYLAQMRHVSPAAVDEIVSKLALDAITHKRLSQLSGGQLRLVGIAQALLGQPELLLLDELSSGLDVVEREQVYRLLSNRNKLTIFSTHIAEEAERIAQTVIVLHEGKVGFCGTVNTLLASAANHVYEYQVTDEVIPEGLHNLVTTRIIPNGSSVLVRTIGKLPQSTATPVAPTLEDAYLWLIQNLLEK